MSISRICNTIASSITIFFGIWHFFVPTWWDWYSYLPTAASELTIAIRAINFFFSLSLVLLGGISLVFAWKPASSFHNQLILLAMLLLWGLRIILQIIYPQGSAIPSLQYGMLAVFTLTFLLFLITLLATKKGAKESL